MADLNYLFNTWMNYPVNRAPAAMDVRRSEAEKQLLEESQQGVKNVPVETEDALKALATLKALEQAGLGVQEQQSPESEIATRMVATQEPQLDISPIGKLVDTWTGSNLTSGYKAPMTLNERLKLVSEMAGKKQTRDQRMEALKQQLYSKLLTSGGLSKMSQKGVTETTSAMTEETPKAPMSKAPTKTGMGMVWQDFNKDQDVKDSIKARGSFSRIDALFSEGVPMTDAIVIKEIAKLAEGPGKLAKDDYEIIAKAGGLPQKFDQFLEDLTSGRISPDKRKWVKQIVDKMKSQVNSTLEDRIKSYSDTAPMSYSDPTLTKESVYKFLKSRLGQGGLKPIQTQQKKSKIQQSNEDLKNFMRNL